MDTCVICGKLRDKKMLYTSHKICTSCVFDFEEAFVNEDRLNPIKSFPDFSNIISWLRSKTLDQILEVI